MNTRAAKAEFTVDGTLYAITRDDVEAAASRLERADSEAFNQHRAWYALVGTGLYYVKELINEAAHSELSDVKIARLALDSLGFPVLGWAWGDLLHTGHPAHTAAS
ncbi:hypothetical protein [Streptomyces sp. NPDC002994]|uniref:hypothetical protein n=1 Tax=Streptomyces sp. NPDC002994 TaxID=3154441 RepID=UPI0033B10F6B